MVEKDVSDDRLSVNLRRWPKRNSLARHRRSHYSAWASKRCPASEFASFLLVHDVHQNADGASTTQSEQVVQYGHFFNASITISRIVQKSIVSN